MTKEQTIEAMRQQIACDAGCDKWENLDFMHQQVYTARAGTLYDLAHASFMDALKVEHVHVWGYGEGDYRYQLKCIDHCPRCAVDKLLDTMVIK